MMIVGVSIQTLSKLRLADSMFGNHESDAIASQLEAAHGDGPIESILRQSGRQASCQTLKVVPVTDA